MKNEPRMTRRGLAALAAAATGLARPAAAVQTQAAQAAPARSGAGARLEQAAEALDRCKVPRETQPAVQFIP